MFSTLRPAGRARGSTPGPTVLWLLTRQGNGSEEILTSSSGGGARTLHVFSFKEEAELFLSLGGVGDGWRVSQTAASELATVLLGPYRHVDRVALDPLPEGLGAEPLNALASMSRARFADLMLGRTATRTR